MVTLTAIFYWILTHWRALAIAAGLIAVFAIVAGVNRSCERRNTSDALRRAQDAANQSLILQGERDAIRREINADVRALDAERKNQNEITNSLLRGADRDCRITLDCVSGSELDREAADFRRRHGANANANANADAGRR